MYSQKNIFSRKKLLFVFFCLFILFINSLSSKINAYMTDGTEGLNSNYHSQDNAFYERTIRGTRIMHVTLEPNANANSVLNYIKKILILNLMVM